MARNNWKLKETEKAWQNSLKIRLDALGKFHIDVAKSYNNLGAVYLSLGKYDIAIDYFNESLKIKTKTLKEADEEIAMTKGNIGSIY